jgi:hypothetical protein
MAAAPRDGEPSNDPESLTGGLAALVDLAHQRKKRHHGPRRRQLEAGGNGGGSFVQAVDATTMDLAYVLGPAEFAMPLLAFCF